MGNAHPPSIDQLAAWHEAREELPRLSVEAAVRLIGRHTRAAWLREAVADGNCAAKIVGGFWMPTDTDRRWPVLALRITRAKTPACRKRVAIVLLTKTQPGRWTVQDRAKLPPTLEPWDR